MINKSMKEKLTRERLNVDYFKNELSEEVNRSLSIINNNRKSRIIGRTTGSARVSKISSSNSELTNRPNKYLSEFNQVIRNYREKKHSEMLESQDITVSGTMINHTEPRRIQIQKRVMNEVPVSNIPNSRARQNRNIRNGNSNLGSNRFLHDMPTLRTSRSYNNLQSNPNNYRGSQPKASFYENPNNNNDYYNKRLGPQRGSQMNDADYNPDKFKNFIQSTFHGGAGPRNQRESGMDRYNSNRFAEHEDYSQRVKSRAFPARNYEAAQGSSENYKRTANYLRVNIHGNLVYTFNRCWKKKYILGFE